MTIQNIASTTYTATGQKQVIEQTFYIDTVRTHITAAASIRNERDPIAQTFGFNTDTLLTSIGLYFRTKGTNSVTLQIRNVVNGYPGPLVYGSKTIQADSIGVSTTSLTETKFTFGDPILCLRDNQYCFVLLTDDTQYRLWVAKMGERDVNTNAYVPAQPFAGGTLFTSSDDAAWTAHQDIDLKFNLYQAHFTDEDAVIIFNQLTSIEAARLVLAVNQQMMTGSSVKWEASADGSTNWLPMNVNSGVNILPAKWTNAYVRATLIGDGVSPIINLGALVATGIKFATVSLYVNRTITSPSFTKINVWYDLKANGGTVTAKYSVDGGNNWVNCTAVSNTTGYNAGFTQYYFQNTVSASTQVKLRLDITGSETATPEIQRLMCTLT